MPKSCLPKFSGKQVKSVFVEWVVGAGAAGWPRSSWEVNRTRVGRAESGAAR